MSEAEAVIERAATKLAELAWKERREALDFLSPAQLCGQLDISPKTLATLDIPRHVIVEGKVIRYRVQDVEAWAATKRECD